MLNEHFAKLLARKLSGESTPEEEEELRQYLQDHLADQYFVELLSGYWNNRTEKKSPDSLSTQQFQQIIEQAENDNATATSLLAQTIPDRKNSPFTLLKNLSIAALLGGIVVGGFLLLNFHERKASEARIENHQNEVVAGPGSRSHLLLPDGSQVWLNSASKLTFNETFTDTMREVELEGEAFFDVVKDKKRPFIVHTSALDIRVLGTTFNLKSYPQDATIEALLLKGLLQVINTEDPQGRGVILRPRDKMVFKKNEHRIIRQREEEAPAAVSGIKPEPAIAVTHLPGNVQDTAIIETAWVYNKLLFEGDNFSELASKMERWYNVRISFASQKVANYRFRGAFQNETVRQALDALKLTAPFNYEINRNEIRIYER